MKGNAKHYDKLREYLETVPLVDCHDHTTTCGPKYADPISVVVSGYFISDLQSASSDSDIAIMQDSNLSLEQRWAVLEKAWKRTCHTGYAQVTKRLLKKFYSEDELTLDALKRMKSNLVNLEDEDTFDDILGQANIAVRLENVMYDRRYEPINNLLALGIRQRQKDREMLVRLSGDGPSDIANRRRTVGGNRRYFNALFVQVLPSFIADRQRDPAVLVSPIRIVNDPELALECFIVLPTTTVEP